MKSIQSAKEEAPSIESKQQNVLRSNCNIISKSGLESLDLSERQKDKQCTLNLQIMNTSALVLQKDKGINVTSQIMRGNAHKTNDTVSEDQHGETTYWRDV
eukprot:665138_1